MADNRCPNCSRKLVEIPAGHEAPCGRQVTWDDEPAVLHRGAGGFLYRIPLVERCEKARARVA